MPFALNQLKKGPWLLNGICPYFTMFPLDYPVNILNGIEEEAVLLDPFCGRGTAVFSARMFNFPAYGIDSNPVAVAVSKAKMANVTVDEIMDTFDIAIGYQGVYPIPEMEFWQNAYHPIVLDQICRVRAYLLQTNGISQDALRGIMLGALHGPKAKKVENNNYFSNQMPRTYGAKPGYSVQYWHTHNMTPDHVDVRRIVKRRTERFFTDAMPEVENLVVFGDSRNPQSYEGFNPITTIITSPPYYGMRTYYTDQWIRNWFLGGPENPNRRMDAQFDHQSPEDFAADLSTVWTNCAEVASDDARMFVRFGGISSRNASALDIILDSYARVEDEWTLVGIADAGTSLMGKRQAIQMLADKESEPRSEYDLELIRNA